MLVCFGCWCKWIRGFGLAVLVVSWVWVASANGFCGGLLMVVVVVVVLFLVFCFAMDCGCHGGGGGSGCSSVVVVIYCVRYIILICSKYYFNV